MSTDDTDPPEDASGDAKGTGPGSEAPESHQPSDGPGEGERIAKVLSRAGIASRRDCERLILEGRVRRNGEVVASPAVNVLPADRLEVDGRRVAEAEPTRLWLFHKPAGLVTTERDEEGRETVFDALPPEMPRVMSVGRLDLTSEGLLLLTNDGEAKRRLELPSTGWLRRYRVRINGALSEDSLDELRRGITVDGFDYEPMEVEFDRQQGANAWLTVGLREGKNREIRRVMEHLGVQVNRLIRVSYGPFQLGNLPSGEVEEVRPKVVRDQLGLGLAPKRTRRPAAAADLPPPEVPRPPRDPLATKLPEGAVKRSLKPRAAPKAQAKRDATRSAAPTRPLPATRPGPTGQRPQRTFLRKDGPRPVTESTEAEARAAARAAREAGSGTRPDTRPERRGDRPSSDSPRPDSPRPDSPRPDRPRPDRPRPERAGGDRPRSAGFRSHGPVEGGERPRSAGFKSHARPAREGGEDRPRNTGPRRPRAGEEGSELPRGRFADRSTDRPRERSGGRADERTTERPGRPARFERQDRGPRPEGDRPPRAPRHGKGGAGGPDRPARPPREGGFRAGGSRTTGPRPDRPRGDRPGGKPGGGPGKGPPRGGAPSGRKPRKD